MDQQVLGTVQLHYFCHFEKWHQKQTAKPLFDTMNPKKLGTNYIAFFYHFKYFGYFDLILCQAIPKTFLFWYMALLMIHQ